MSETATATRMRQSLGAPIPPGITNHDQKLYARVMDFEAPLVIEAIMRDQDCDEDEARARFAEAKQFLFIGYASNELLAPPSEIDEAWHAFVLDTRRYEHFCRSLFGMFLHHEPMSKETKLGQEVGERTVELAMAFLGHENLSPRWQACRVKCSVIKCDCTDGN